MISPYWSGDFQLRLQSRRRRRKVMGEEKKGDRHFRKVPVTSHSSWCVSRGDFENHCVLVAVHFLQARIVHGLLEEAVVIEVRHHDLAAESRTNCVAGMIDLAFADPYPLVVQTSVEDRKS